MFHWTLDKSWSTCSYPISANVSLDIKEELINMFISHHYQCFAGHYRRACQHVHIPSLPMFHWALEKSSSTCSYPISANVSLDIKEELINMFISYLCQCFGGHYRRACQHVHIPSLPMFHWTLQKSLSTCSYPISANVSLINMFISHLCQCFTRH
ncbi:hypothetical protein DPMN_175925 [Dreissena polymorpha]|uniref:Uncharacterized protein n=1 Tax=Dreissena polymorpha TaxID=45954 RepID=A0A9D4IK30_DREPO|nr:hypothetical protein DPMN_175925 [Dreissena polymorpha]